MRRGTLLHPVRIEKAEDTMPEDKANWTLVDLVRRQAVVYGERDFIAFEHGRSLSFAAFDRDSDRLARNLSALGVGREDRVLALLKNRVEFLLAMLAAMKLGAIIVPINTELKGAFLQHQMRNSEPRVVFVEQSLVGAFEGVEGGNDSLAATIVVAGDVPEAMPAVLAGASAMTFDDLAGMEGAGEEVLMAPTPYDIAMIMYTSGTTGPAKGVMMPHAHCYLAGFGSYRTLSLTPDDRYYVCMPLFHGNALLMQIMGALIGGASAYCVERFSPNRWLEDIRGCGATVTNGLGVIPEFIFRTPESEHDRDHRLRRMMAVPVAAEWGHAFQERFGVKLIQGYGMTECNVVAYSHEDDPLVPGCAGYVLDDFFEVRVVDPDTDEPLPAGRAGEIVVRPKEPGCFMQGYYRMPEKTVEAWRNLWFHSGDVGRFDESGSLYFVDRIKDCIRRRGENISSFEIEHVLNDHPAIAESAVVGVRIAGAGGEDEVKACIVLGEGAEIDNIAMLDYCAERMPRYAVPRFIEILDRLDKTATGKVQKDDLRRAGVTAATWDRESVGYVLARS